MISPTDIPKEAVLADIRANGPSLVKDITSRLLGLSPKAAKGLARTHTKHYERVYSVLQTLVRLGEVATEVSRTRRAKYQRRGKYYLVGRDGAGTETAISEVPPEGGSKTLISGGGVFGTREDGVVFRYAPVSSDPNGEWAWHRVPDLPRD